MRGVLVVRAGLVVRASCTGCARPSHMSPLHPVPSIAWPFQNLLCGSERLPALSLQFEMLTGSLPFQGKDRKETMGLILK